MNSNLFKTIDIGDAERTGRDEDRALATPHGTKTEEKGKDQYWTVVALQQKLAELQEWIDNQAQIKRAMTDVIVRLRAEGWNLIETEPTARGYVLIVKVIDGRLTSRHEFYYLSGWDNACAISQKWELLRKLGGYTHWRYICAPDFSS